ncbi:MAG: helix-turn-helix domain-containing protein [bacterium]|nr:helix-turn-helix domain-containing protein [bacterium]
MDIGQRIKRLREDAGLTREELARELGLSYWAVSKYETGDRVPPSDVLKKLGAFLRVSTDYLLGLPEADSLDPTLRPILNNPAFLEAVKHPAVRDLLASSEVQIYLRAAASLEEMDAESLISIAEAVKDAKQRLAARDRERPDST